MPRPLAARDKPFGTRPGRQTARAPAPAVKLAMQLWLIILCIDLVLVSAVTLGFYAWDKRQSRRHRWRVPEKHLHLLALLGGWPGAWIGQRWLRHKTIKTKFRVVFWLTAITHLSIALTVTYLLWAGRQ